jgi:aromatic ring-opening dioxygenase LigB subunit
MTGGLVFAAIAPHGSMAIDEACEPEERGLARKTQDAFKELGRRFDQARPEATVVLTPHNVHVDGSFAVVIAAQLHGSLSEWTTQEVELNGAVDRELALASIVALVDAGLPAVGISFGGNDPESAVAPMDWATLIPLWYMGGRREPPLPAVVVSPARDRPFAEHRRAGAVLAEAAAASGKRVALIASADHGHAHDLGGPYGYDPAAREYDEAIVDVVENDRLAELDSWEADFVERAKADSFWQLLMLDGALQHDGGWRSELLSYEAPTYFGMLCAAYEKNEVKGGGFRAAK